MQGSGVFIDDFENMGRPRKFNDVRIVTEDRQDQIIHFLHLQRKIMSCSVFTSVI